MRKNNCVLCLLNVTLNDFLKLRLSAKETYLNHTGWMVLCVAMNVSDGCCHLTTVQYSSHVSHPPLLIMVTTFAPSHHVFTRCPEERTHSGLYSHSQPLQPLTAEYCPVPCVADFLPARFVYAVSQTVRGHNLLLRR